MRIAIPREAKVNEPRVPIVPKGVAELVKMGATVGVEADIGATVRTADSSYAEAGANVISDRAALLHGADLVLRLNPPPIEEVAMLEAGAIHVSHLDPFFNQHLIEVMATHNINAVCVELIPRTMLAQKMDALSSQASLAGYVAVVLAAERLAKSYPMMMTPAGTLRPSRVFVIGAGVAGLQAIATAKRMGARVSSFDTRPVAEEQIESLGARCVKIDLGNTGQTEGGYAKELTAEQLEKQRQGMAEICAASDVVITTAKLFGRTPPLIIDEDMVAGMKPGSVIVDMAVGEHGGNVAGTQLNKEVDIGGVQILGFDNLPGRVAVHASQMYSNNLVNFFSHFWDNDAKSINLDRTDEIMGSALITCGGQIVSERLNKAYAGV